MTLIKRVIFCGVETAIACDGRCEKAWGFRTRSRNSEGFLRDEQLGLAPENPGTSEGECIKPQNESERLNKWCARECERCVIAPIQIGIIEDSSKYEKDNKSAEDSKVQTQRPETSAL